MLYLKNISTPQVIYIPKGRKADGKLILSLKSTINQSVLEQNVIDEWGQGLYFKLSVKLPTECPSGEYEYTLTDAAGVLSTGLLIVDNSVSPTEYKKVIQYEQCK